MKLAISYGNTNHGIKFQIPLVIKEEKIKYLIIMFNSEICKLENDLHKNYEIIKNFITNISKL